MMRLFLVCGVGLIASSALAQSGFSVGDRCVLKRPINVKTGAEGKGKPVKVKKGTELEILDIRKNKIQVKSDDIEGFALAGPLGKTCEVVTKPAEPPAPAPLPTVAAEPPVLPPTPPAAPEPPPPAPSPTPPLAAPDATKTEPAVAPAAEAGPAPVKETEVVAAQPPTVVGEPPQPELAPLPLSRRVQAGVVARGTSASGEPGAALGFYGAWLENSRLSLGAAGFVTLWDPLFADAAYRNNRYLRFFYLGLEAGYALIAAEPLGMRVRAFGGAGGVSHHSYHSGDVSSDMDLFFVVEPSVELFMAVMDRLQVGLGIGYRFSFGASPATSLNRMLVDEDATHGLLNGVNIDIAVRYDIF